MSYQKVIIMGNIGKIEQRFTPGGDSVVNFSVAVNERYKKKDGTQVDDTEWFNCVSWGKQSEVIIQYFSKGSRILIEGSMKTRQWEDNQGAKRYNTDLKVTNFNFVDKLSDNTQKNQQQQNQGAQQGHQQNAQQNQPTGNQQEFNDDTEIPF